MKTLLSVSTLLLAATPAAQAQQPANPAVTTTRQLWELVTGFITAAARDMPEADYAFRPVSSVRSFGQLIGHVAGAQYMFCSAALGDTPREEGEIERSRTSKADLIAALQASTEYCKRAYAQSDAAALGTAQLFGQARTRLFALTQNAVHNGEHYGNLVTYLRIKGMVPPSSRPAQ